MKQTGKCLLFYTEMSKLVVTVYSHSDYDDNYNDVAETPDSFSNEKLEEYVV